MKVIHTIAVSLLCSVLGALPASAQDKPPVGCTDLVYRQSDFILGTWDVYAGEKKNAEVTIDSRLGGCTLTEMWTTPAGSKGNGLGLMTYSTLLKSWHYHWAADTGSTTVFTGSLRGPGNMLYVTEKPLPDGRKRARHWTLVKQPDGSVRELSVGSDDGGKTWTIEYDLKWVKKN